jgi:hypothetical protein
VGTIWRYAGQRAAEPTRPYELEARRTNALQYTSALMRDPKKLVNEIVVEYRKHAAGKFPVFTRIDHTRKRFYILDPAKNFAETGEYIDNDGTVKKD